jgi:hypothetical protein
MNQYVNEDMAWLRLQDVQREAENRRLTAGGRRPALIQTVRRLFARTARRRLTPS